MDPVAAGRGIWGSNKHEIYAAAFSANLFMTYFCRATIALVPCSFPGGLSLLLSPCSFPEGAPERVVPTERRVEHPPPPEQEKQAVCILLESFLINN